MNEEKLIQAIVEKILASLKQDVSPDLRVVTLFTGSLTGLKEAVAQLRILEESGYQAAVDMTPDAAALFSDRADPQDRDYLWNRKVTEKELAGEWYEKSDVILLPVLTINSAAKMVHGIADNSVLRIIQGGLLEGKKIIAARNACLPEGICRTTGANAYLMNLKKNVSTLSEFGIRFVDVNELSSVISARAEGSDTKKPETETYLDARLLDVNTLRAAGAKNIYLPEGAVITPLARDYARSKGIGIHFGKQVTL